MQARRYQTEAIEAAFREWETVRSTLVQIPTGGGKTFVAAECAKRQQGRTMFIVHLREIVRQAKDELHAMTGLPVGLELSHEKSSAMFPEPIICASVQTLNGKGRLAKFNPEEFSLIVVDEAHHSEAKSWKKVLDYFPNAKVLCLTATPERADKKALSIDSVAYQYTLKQACDEGYLCKPRQLTNIIPGLKFKDIPRKKGDYSEKELSDIMIRYATACAHRSIEAIFNLYPHELDTVPEENWSEYVGDRPAKKTLIFCVTRLHAEKVMNALNSFRERLCGYVDGETDHLERRNIFRDFKRGDLVCLANCGVTTEGYDNPNIQNILMMRPTMSRSLFLQMIGRGSRTLKGTLDGIETAEERIAAIANSAKPFCTVVDFTDNSRDIRLVTVVNILSGEQPPPIQRELEKRVKEKAVDVEEEIKLILKERYELGKTNFEETEIDGFTGKRKKKKLTREQKDARRKARDSRPLTEKEKEQIRRAKRDPAKYTLEANRFMLRKITHRKLANLCSYEQIFKLQKIGYTLEQLEGMKSWEATNILQFNVLRRYGYTQEQFDAMTYDQRKRAIDVIAQNGWKRPAQTEQSFTDRLIHETAEDYFGAPAF